MIMKLLTSLLLMSAWTLTAATFTNVSIAFDPAFATNLVGNRDFVVTVFGCPTAKFNELRLAGDITTHAEGAGVVINIKLINGRAFTQSMEIGMINYEVDGVYRVAHLGMAAYRTEVDIYLVRQGSQIVPYVFTVDVGGGAKAAYPGDIDGIRVVGTLPRSPIRVTKDFSH